MIFAPNKKIKSFATAHWDAQETARPLFRRYALKPKGGNYANIEK